MIPQVQDVFNAARFHLGDTATPSGQIFTNNYLQGFWPNAYGAGFRILERNSSKLLRVTKYFNVPANTSYITPAGMGLLNMGKPEHIWDRLPAQTFNATIAAVNPVSLGTPPSIDLTISNPGLQAGTQVVTFGFGNADWGDDPVQIPPTTISDDINGQWYIGVPDANTIRLLGCAAQDYGSAVGSTGILSTGSGGFGNQPLAQWFDVTDFPLTAQNACLTTWKWENGAFIFNPSNVTRQIRISFMLSATPPASGSVGIDDSGDAFALYLGGLAAASKVGFANKSGGLFTLAVGNPTGDESNLRGGAFYSLVQIGIQAMNETRVVQPRFRQKRNVGWRQFWGSRW